MADLRLVDEPSVTPDDLRARIQSADIGSLVLADKLADHVLKEPGDLLGRVIVAQQYLELRRTARRLRAWLAEVEG